MDSGETGNIPTSYNEAAVKAFIDIANDIKDKFNIEGNVHLEHLLSLPDLIQYSDSSQDQEELEKHIALNLDLAIDQMIEMRKKEGENLVTDLKARISTIENILNEIERLEPTRICDWKEKFEERLKGLLQNLELDPIRLIQEASIVADRLDITEEIIRFRSHNQLFLNTLKTGGSQGKNLALFYKKWVVKQYAWHQVPMCSNCCLRYSIKRCCRNDSRTSDEYRISCIFIGFFVDHFDALSAKFETIEYNYK